MIYRFPTLREILAKKHYGTGMVISQGSQPCYTHFWLKCMLIIACLSVLLMSVTFVTDGLIWNHIPNDIPQQRFKSLDIIPVDQGKPFSEPNDPATNTKLTAGNSGISKSRDNLLMDVSVTGSRTAPSNSSGTLKLSSSLPNDTNNASRYPIVTRSTALSRSSRKVNGRSNSSIPSNFNQNSAVLNSSEYLEIDGNNTTNQSFPLCPKVSPLLVGPIAPSMTALTDQQILAANPNLQPGGLYKPPNCRARQRIAVIVVYRDRKEHLQIFLNNIHPVLQKQQLDYRIFIVEQAGTSAFNRGMLFNAGYKEVKRAYNYDCFIMHDVDLLPENDRNPYSCRAVPTLLASAISSNQYKMPYETYFGAAVSFTAEQFARINGFANVYWGWGGEDDDLSVRVRSRYYDKSGVSSLQLGRYKMIKHGRENGNPINPQRFDLMHTATVRFFTDGLSNLNYSVLATEARPLYTWILVDIGHPPDELPITRTYSTNGLWGG